LQIGSICPNLRCDNSLKGKNAMRTLVHEKVRLQKGNEAAASSRSDRANPRAFLQHNVGNQALQRVFDKSVEGQPQTEEIVEDNDTLAGSGSDPVPMAPPTPAPPAPAPAKKKAGVDSFAVNWTKNTSTSSTTAKLRLDYTAKFKKDANYDPAFAEFRQNAFHLFEVTDGPHKGQKHNNDPLHDDNYSRADDMNGNTISDVDFVSNDNPGPVAGSLDPNDVIDYSFTAEQMIIDTSDSNKVIEKRGPHTATIKGKHPRAFTGVPKAL
jgi:hypothetical protein